MTTSDAAASWGTVEAAVRGYLLRRLHGDEATADDLVQEVFLRLRRGLDDLRRLDRLGPWVMRLSRSVLVDHLRRRRLTAPLVDTPAPVADASDELALLATCVRQQVDHLPAHEAAAIRQVDLAGVPAAEAAMYLGIGLPALKARLRRGRAHLRAGIDRSCEVLLDARGQPTACEPRSDCAGCGSPTHDTGDQS